MRELLNHFQLGAERQVRRVHELNQSIFLYLGGDTKEDENKQGHWKQVGSKPIRWPDRGLMLSDICKRLAFVPAYDR